MSKHIWQKFLSPEQNIKTEEHQNSLAHSPMIFIATPPSQHVIDVPPAPPNSNELAKNNKLKTPTLISKMIVKAEGTKQRESDIKKIKGKQIGSCFDLKIRSKHSQTNGNKTGNSSEMIKSNQKSSVLLNGKQKSCQLTSKRKQSDKFFLPSSFKNTSNTKNLLGLSKYSQNEHQHSNHINNEEEQQDSFSQLFLRQINKTQQNKIKKMKEGTDPEVYFYDMFITLKEIRDIEKENLINNKKMMKLMEESVLGGKKLMKSDTLNGQNDIESRTTHQKKGTVKQHRQIKKSSLRRISQKQKDKSTIKKGKGSIIEEKMQKVTDKLKEIEKFKMDLEEFVRKTQHSQQLALNSKTKKKSLSAFR